MDYTPRHAQPFTYAQARELEIPEITKEISRLENSLYHLNRTQVELNGHLTGSDEEDHELLEILKENESVIASQKERISMLKLVLEEQGINTRSVHYNSSISVGIESAPNQPHQNSSITIPHSDSGQLTQESSDDGGVYL